MERKLYRGIMTPAMVLTLVTGAGCGWDTASRGGWLHAKLAASWRLVAYHFWLGSCSRASRATQNRHPRLLPLDQRAAAGAARGDRDPRRCVKPF
jgi:uncharacterized membrane protein